MANFEANATYTVNGVLVKEKIIPDGTKWTNADKAQDAGFNVGDLYKKQQKLSNNSGTVQSITIHNTNDLENVNDDGESYTIATYNENMGSARVHFYVDDVCAWQNLRAGTGMCTNDPLHTAEVGWHAGDGSIADGGNMTSLAIEIIMGDTNAVHDQSAKDNGARLAAWLLWKHDLTIENLVTHTYWVNKSVGNHFDNVDVQCTNLVSGKKWCPYYIFGGYNTQTAYTNWMSFKSLVQDYLDELNTITVSFNADYYYNNQLISQTFTKRIKIGDTYGTMPQPTRSGYTFVGWWPESAKESHECTSGTVMNRSTNHTLYAHWAKKYLIKVSGNQEYLRVSTNLTALSNGVSVRTQSTTNSIASSTPAYQWYISDIAGKKLIRSVVDPAYGLNNSCSEDCCKCNIYKTAGNENNAVTTYQVDDDGVLIQWYDFTGRYLSTDCDVSVCWAQYNKAAYQHWELIEVS